MYGVISEEDLKDREMQNIDRSGGSLDAPLSRQEYYRRESQTKRTHEALKTRQEYNREAGTDAFRSGRFGGKHIARFGKSMQYHVEGR